MKKLLLFFLMMTAIITFSWAQRVVSGTVKSAEDGINLPGVAIVIVGTTQGTVTDGEGNFRLEVPDGARLQFSFVGYKAQEIEVGTQSVINVSLLTDVTELSEIVVTALGVERDTKALGYSVTSVEGDNFTQARETNLSNALEGRIAGVNVSKMATGPAGSSRVIIRGNKSLLGMNQPLYVVDGIPMDNTNYGQAGMWGGTDEGDNMASINPDDIESITVLKGASAAALYGARAANGVINIVTKKGSARKGIGVEFNSNFVMEKYMDLRDYQTEYGQGNFVNSDPTDPTSPRIAVAPRTQQEAYNWNTTSFGPRLGSGTFVNILGDNQPYVNAGDNWPRFFETGKTWTNTLALSGGSENQTFRFAFSDLRSSAIKPNTGYDRQNISMSTNSKFGQKLTFNAKVLYSHEFADNRQQVSDAPNNTNLSMYYIPANVNVDWYKGDPNKLGAVPPDADAGDMAVFNRRVGDELPSGEHYWHQNPWWVANQFDNDDRKDRVITSGQMRYNITDWLWIQGRGGMDWVIRRQHDITPMGTSHNFGGNMNEQERRIREINLEWMAGFDKTFGPLGVNAFVGGNRMRHSDETMNLNGTNFNVPFFEVINNTVTRTWGYGFSEFGINSIFGSAEFSYNNFLFLTGTFRNDWFSVLNPERDNEVFYPSVGGAFVLSEAVELPEVISFGKIRASWARVGNATINPYDTRNTYSLNGNTHLGYTMASYTSAGGNNGLIPNPNLVPLESSEIEVGFDVRFMQNRLGIDFTYYDQHTKKDILNATISRASGFGRTSVNLGELRNRGVEVLITATPVTGPLTWDLSLNFAKNDNEVVSLIEGQDELVLEEPRNRNAFIKHIVGQPFGVITGTIQATSPNGDPLYYTNGTMVATNDFHIIGNGVPDFTGGLTNSLTYKNFNLSFLIDFKSGGDILSGTNMRLTQAGFTKMSLEGREGKTPLHITGVVNTGTADVPVYTPVDRDLTPSEARNYWGNSGGDADGITPMYLYDASFIKLRQVGFGYNFPRTMLAKTPFNTVSLSFVARNLAILHKNTPNIDPESAYTNSNSQGFDYFGYIPTRTYGFDLKLQF